MLSLAVLSAMAVACREFLSDGEARGGGLVPVLNGSRNASPSQTARPLQSCLAVRCLPARPWEQPLPGSAGLLAEAQAAGLCSVITGDAPRKLNEGMLPRSFRHCGVCRGGLNTAPPSRQGRVAAVAEGRTN